MHIIPHRYAQQWSPQSPQAKPNNLIAFPLPPVSLSFSRRRRAMYMGISRRSSTSSNSSSSSSSTISFSSTPPSSPSSSSSSSKLPRTTLTPQVPETHPRRCCLGVFPQNALLLLLSLPLPLALDVCTLTAEKYGRLALALSSTW